jgi:hypothetical protein
MRYLLACCLLLVACGDDDAAGGPSDAGAAGARAGRSAGTGGVGAGTSGAGGTRTIAGRNGEAGSGGRATGGSEASAGTHASGGAGAHATTGTIRLVPNIVAGTQKASGNGTAGIGSSESGLRVGSATGTTLHSLKYYIISIQLCENVELMGSGYSNSSGCIDLYRNQTAGSPDYDTYMVDAARNDTTAGRYIDLMSSAGQAALRHAVTLQVPISPPPSAAGDDDAADGGTAQDDAQPHAYRYGLINFYRPIKVTAEFPIIGSPGEMFRTKAVSEILPGPTDGSHASDRVLIGNTLDGATEETTYMLNNGGALFVFQKPFAITQADVDAQAEIKVDLVFNPENFGQAYEQSGGCHDDQHATVCDPTNNVVIDMPFVRMSPVPRKTGEHTHKETYLMDYEADSKLRIELYYNDADPQAGVQGVDTAIVYGTTAPSVMSGNTIASNFVSQTGSVLTSDASVTLLDYQHMPNLEGLRRRQAGTVTIHCVFTGSVCPTAGGEVTRAYSYIGDSVVSGN